MSTAPAAKSFMKTGLSRRRRPTAPRARGRNAQILAYFSLLLLAGLALTATAAEETNKAIELTNAPIELTNKPVELASRPDYWCWTFGVEGGSAGIFGAFGRWRFSDHLALRAGVDFTKDSESAYGIHDIHYDVKALLLSEPLTLDFFPWKKHSFYVSFGWLFNQNELTGFAVDQGTIIIDHQSFPVADVGALNLRVRQQLINPYLSIGGNFFYFDRSHRWALGGELGVAYTGEPQVSLTRSGPPDATIDAAVRAEQNRIQDWANQFKFYPVAKISLSFSF